MKSPRPIYLIALISCAWLGSKLAVAQPQFSRVLSSGNHEIALTLTSQTGAYYQIEAANDLNSWNVLTTVASGAASSLQYTDSAAAFLPTRYYRAQQLVGSNIFVGDHLSTTNGELVLQSRIHATLLLSWQDKTIYIDPTNTTPYAGVPKADLILITHAHSDHFNTAAITAVRGTNGLIFSTQDVYNQLTATQKPFARILNNGASTNVIGLNIEAVPAYNSYHPLGTGNGYVLTIGGQRIYVSGDSGNTPEMRALTNIDVAFLCMNQPYTMTVSEATNAVTAFRPKVVYPYHYRDQSGASANAGNFKQLLNPALGVEVRLRKWY